MHLPVSCFLVCVKLAVNGQVMHIRSNTFVLIFLVTFSLKSKSLASPSSHFPPCLGFILIPHV